MYEISDASALTIYVSGTEPGASLINKVQRAICGACEVCASWSVA